jgi:chromosome segregation ATPase
MKSDPAVPADQTALLRQQLILAQVRIMELEDARDELGPQLAGTEKLLAAAQTLADAKLAESAHLTTVLAGLQGQCDHLRHVQHVTNEALTAARRELEAVTARAAAAEQRGQQLQKELVDLAAEAGRLHTTLDRLGLELAEATTLAASRLERINQLDTEVRAMKASRSWRWTAWLRSLERALGSDKKHG